MFETVRPTMAPSSTRYSALPECCSHPSSEVPLNKGTKPSSAANRCAVAVRMVRAETMNVFMGIGVFWVRGLGVGVVKAVLSTGGGEFLFHQRFEASSVFDEVVAYFIVVTGF